MRVRGVDATRLGIARFHTMDGNVQKPVVAIIENLDAASTRSGMYSDFIRQNAVEILQQFFSK